MSLHPWCCHSPCTPTAAPSHSVLTGAELPQARKSPITISPVSPYLICHHISCDKNCWSPCMAGIARVPFIQATVPSMHDPHWDRVARGNKKKKKILHEYVWSFFGRVQLFGILWVIACGLLYPRDPPGKKNSGVGCHVLLEHQISCCPSHHLVLAGTDASPPGKPQEQTPVDDSHAEVEIKPQLKPRGTVAKRTESFPNMIN